MNAILEQFLTLPAVQRFDDDPSFNASLDASARECLATGQSLDDAVENATAIVRRLAPNHIPPSRSDWEAEWRSYFRFYDHAVARTIRAYIDPPVRRPE
jgi:hypothetical protein